MHNQKQRERERERERGIYQFLKSPKEALTFLASPTSCFVFS